MGAVICRPDTRVIGIARSVRVGYGLSGEVRARQRYAGSAERVGESTKMFRSFDAAYPPQAQAPGCAAVLGYIGGQTPHVWTLPEWQRFGHLRQAPIWVYWPGRDPIRDAANAGLAMQRLGWTPNVNRFCVLDMETSVDVGWVSTFAAELRASGYATVVYGSAAFVHGNPPEAGYWIADWDGLTDIPAGTVAHQFAANQPVGGTKVDYSVWEDAWLDRFGFGPRR